MATVVSVTCLTICHISLLLSGNGRKPQIPLSWLTLQITTNLLLIPYLCNRIIHELPYTWSTIIIVDNYGLLDLKLLFKQQRLPCAQYSWNVFSFLKYP